MIKKTLIAGLLSAITVTSALAADNLNVNVPNVRAILPPPPKPGSLVYQNDMDISHASFFVRDAKRYKQAQSDAVIDKAKAFEKAFGHPINAKDTPVIWKMIKQLEVTDSKFTKPVKIYYHRTRPFVYFHEKACVPTDTVNRSYPSGHTV